MVIDWSSGRYWDAELGDATIGGDVLAFVSE